MCKTISLIPIVVMSIITINVASISIIIAPIIVVSIDGVTRINIDAHLSSN